MKFLSHSMRRFRALSLAALAALATIFPPAAAASDYDQIGRQFSLVLQNLHFSRERFSAEKHTQFLNHYLQSLDPQHLYFTREDVDQLHRRYAATFGDYLLTGQTVKLAEELYAAYSTRALRYLNQVEKLLAEYEANPPAFDSDRSIPRTRRKLPRAANQAELNQVWRDQVEDMLLSEISRRENAARLAEEKGKPAPSQAKEVSPIDKLRARLKRLRLEVQEADQEDMVSHLLNAVAHVYDPHSDYMGARDEQRFKDMIKASIMGIGAQLREDDDGSTRIEGIVKGGPAARSGQLHLGDHIVAVDSQGDDNWTDILYMSLDKVVNLIRGQRGVPVRLRVQRAESGEERVVSIVREEVPMAESLASAKIVNLRERGPQGEERTYRLGILTLPSFYVDLDGNGVECAADVKKLLQRMVQEGVEGLVIDLRFNGGGSLEEVRKMVGFFTGAGPVVQVKDSRGNLKRYTVGSIPVFRGQMVVLTNTLSASASEIFAGAMQDYGRAVIVGDTTTFGKGTVQEARSLMDYMPIFSSRDSCGMIKVTLQKFYRINGTSTQLRGVESDITLPSVTSALQIGEGEQEYALPYDSIPPTGSYVQDPHLRQILPKLRELSQARVAADNDLQYNEWYTNYRRHLIEENRISLNKETRRAEAQKLREFTRAANDERKTRYTALAKDDAEHLTVRRLNLSDVHAAQLPLATKDDQSDFIEEAKDPEEDEQDDTPDYPSTLDPLLRESLYIVRDMIDLR